MRVALAFLVAGIIALATRSARAEDAVPPARGVVVVAAGQAVDAAWPLAQAVYASAALRPSTLDETRARVLCGEAPARGAPGEVTDLAADVAAVHGDDAPSRALLADIARRMQVRAVVVVASGAPKPTARVFLAESGALDAASYLPDDDATVSWKRTVQSLERTFGSLPPPTATRPAAKRAEPPKQRPLYASPWLWGGLAAAAALGAAIYLTHDNGPTMLHLQMNIGR
jgi:hypothetical protein